ncbi:hypothetical protein [Pandoraea fibrosis]|uniref:Uncharacterized protein n=1 Tax=Pandoraea fibrosis TaxID=1891094 RepID=A0A5E4YJD5_9BURK|nr:hypothetical protein [Pandoraea fibrosis]QHE93331.1 hypothetical protein PJ20_016965 [Pandoraea fibrosis]QHF13109.1 hypothetical protein PI93_011035 [Pandoraea fibrosis]VVE48612.1 hypothetical protein PFI31113_04524 [Pandoraea fibrosis]
MKMIVIVDKQGALVAAQQSDGGLRGQVAGIAAGPDQKAHVIDVPDDVVQLKDPQAFASRIGSLVPRA